MKKIFFGILAVLGFFSESQAAVPTIIWASDPVRPGEAVMVRGDGFGKKSTVEVASGSATASGQKNPWKAVPVLQQTDATLKFALPADLSPGICRFRVKAGSETSEPSLLNVPRIWWMQGDHADTATPGGWIRIFGLNLDLPAGSKVTLSDGNGSLTLPPVSIDPSALRVDLPPTIAPGTYHVTFASGEKNAVPVEAGPLVIKEAAALPTQTFSVTDFGAVPGEPEFVQYYTGMMAPGQVDSADAIQRCLDAAGAAGGGIVSFPRGIFILSHGVTVPPHVILRGAGRGLTSLSWVDDMLPRDKEEVKNLTWGSLLYKTIKDPGNPPHPYLIRGEGCFTVEDMAIYAVNHHSGIMSEHAGPNAGHVAIRRVLMRVDRFINTDDNSRHYADHEEVQQKRYKDILRVGAIQIGGPDIEITDCDLYSSGGVLLLDASSGVIARNRISSRPRHWTTIARRCEKLIFEQNDCSNGGISILNVHRMMSNDLQTKTESIYSRDIYFARNSVKDCFREDRDGGFIPDFHAPLGIYAGLVASASGTTVNVAGRIEGSDLGTTWRGAVVTIMEGKGAGQFRFLKNADAGDAGGGKIEVDRPWYVVPDSSSFITVSKCLLHALVVDNDFRDSGNAVSFWGGGLEVLAARNKSVRGGSFNMISLCHDGQFIPGLRAQFLDNEITEGINLGAAYIFPRGSIIGTLTYTPLAFERTLQQNKGKPVTAPDYHGPLSIDQVFRRNRIDNNGHFYAGGVVSDILFDQGSVSDASIGTEVTKVGGRWDPALFTEGPHDVLIRDTMLRNVTTPCAGDQLSEATIIGK